VYFAVYSVLAQSLNLLVGYCGLLTLAHTAFFAVGAYAYALVALKLGWGWVASTLLATTLAGLLSLALSLPSWRFRGDSFVLLSMALQVVAQGLFLNWYAEGAPVGTWSNLGNGPFGLSGIPQGVILGIQLDTPGHFLVVAALALAATIALVGRLVGAPWGRLLKAMRDDELAARGLGKYTRFAKVQAAAVACSLAGLAGALYAAYVRFVDPSSASLGDAILLLAATLLGGTGNLRGPLLGAATLVLLPEALRVIDLPPSMAANVRLMVFGALLVAIVHLRPQGLLGEYRIE
jgi:branched-chain amino acid transport system permease protein